MTTREKVLISILVVAIVLMGGSLAYAYKDKILAFKDKIVATPANSTSSQVALNQNINSDLISNQNSNSAATETALLIDSGVTWQNPVKLDDLKLLKVGTDAGIVSVDYYKIATIAQGGEVILADITFDGPGGSKIFMRFRSTVDNKYYYLKNHSDDMGITNSSEYLSTGVITDNQTVYSQITSPGVLKTDIGSELSKSGGDYFLKDLDPKPSKVAGSEYGSIYTSITNNENKAIAMHSVFLSHSDGTVTVYAEKIGFMNSGIPNITLNSGEKNTTKYIPNTIFACGSVSDTTVIAGDVNISNYTIFGQTSEGDKTYTSNDVNNDVVKAIYDNYKVGRNNDVISIADFAAKAPYFFWRDKFNNYIVFVNENYSSLAECGKPVIYLYPQKETQVSVKVGASITKSEPAYNQGWTVTALPSGKLLDNGVPYPYLFWEGQGQNYPSVTEGSIVKQSDIKITLEKQLTLLGLNEKESADFMEFWLPKMPKTAYVRLSWLGTYEMNKLAPLTVSPKPDTMIRVFLDFEGLNKPYEIKQQKLSAPDRKGFTLVEWGGLLVGSK